MDLLALLTALLVLVTPLRVLTIFHSQPAMDAEVATSKWAVFELTIFEPNRDVRGTQQTWFLSEDTLATAAHGVIHCGELSVTFPNGRTTPATLWRVDEQADIAWLKCPKPLEARAWSVVQDVPPVGSDVRLITSTREGKGQVLAVRGSLLDGVRIETSIGSVVGDSGAILVQEEHVVGVVTSLRRGVRGRLAAATPAAACMNAAGQDKSVDLGDEANATAPSIAAAKASELASRGMRDDAIRLYGELFTDDKLDAVRVYAYCLELIDAARWSELENVLSAWKRRGRDLWLWEYVSGSACQSRRQYEDAIPHYQRSLELHKNVDTYVSLCALLEWANRDGECEALIDDANRIGLADAALLCIRSRIQAKNGRTGEALATAREAYARDRRAPIAGQLIEALRSSGLKEGACELAAGLINQPDMTYAVCRSAGNVLWECGRRDEAIQFYRLALKVEPLRAEGWASLGRVEDALGNRSRAIEALETSLKLSENADVMRDLCLLYNAAGKTALYQRTLDRLREVSPENYQTVVGRVSGGR